MNQDPRSWNRGLVLLGWLVFGAAVLLLFWGIWSVPLQSHNEARRLVAVREMVANHQWLTPMKNGVFYFEKPPLYYWTGVFFSLLSGGSTGEWVLRLPSALAALFTTAFLYQRLSLYIGRQPALFSALVLITSHFYVGNARRAELNVFFGMLCFTGLLLYYDYLHRHKKTELYLAFFVLGLAALTKGPVALVFFLPPLLVYGLLRRDWRVFKGLADPLAWVLFAVVGGSWFIYALYGVPDSPLRAVIHKDIAGKVYENVSRDPFYSYVVFLLGSFVPWVLILFYNPKGWLQRLRSAEGQFLACAIGVPLLIMSCFAEKHGKYLLPMFPFCAAFLGWAVSDAYDHFGQRFGKRFQAWFVRLAGALLMLLFAVLVVAPQYTMKYRFVALKPFAEKIRLLQGGNPVFAYSLEPIQLIYYYGAPIPVLDQEQLKEKMKEEKPFLLVAKDADRVSLEGKGLCLLEEFAHYLKDDRQGLLYGASDYCKSTKGLNPDLSALPPAQ